MFFSSISKMNVDEVDNKLVTDSIKLLSKISGDVSKIIVKFI